MKEEEMWAVRAVMFEDVENRVCDTAVFDCLKNKESKSLCS